MCFLCGLGQSQVSDVIRSMGSTLVTNLVKHILRVNGLSLFPLNFCTSSMWDLSHFIFEEIKAKTGK